MTHEEMPPNKTQHATFKTFCFLNNSTHIAQEEWYRWKPVINMLPHTFFLSYNIIHLKEKHCILGLYLSLYIFNDFFIHG